MEYSIAHQRVAKSPQFERVKAASKIFSRYFSSSPDGTAPNLYWALYSQCMARIERPIILTPVDLSDKNYLVQATVSKLVTHAICDADLKIISIGQVVRRDPKEPEVYWIKEVLPSSQVSGFAGICYPNGAIILDDEVSSKLANAGFGLVVKSLNLPSKIGLLQHELGHRRLNAAGLSSDLYSLSSWIREDASFFQALHEANAVVSSYFDSNPKAPLAFSSELFSWLHLPTNLTYFYPSKLISQFLSGQSSSKLSKNIPAYVQRAARQLMDLSVNRFNPEGQKQAVCVINDLADALSLFQHSISENLKELLSKFCLPLWSEETRLQLLAKLDALDYRAAHQELQMFIRGLRLKPWQRWLGGELEHSFTDLVDVSEKLRQSLFDAGI